MVHSERLRPSHDLWAEKSIVRTFVLPQRRRRYLELLDTKAGRNKIKRSLAHFPDFDPRFIIPIPPNAQSAEGIVYRLHEKGALEDCYVWSDSSALDGLVVNLEYGVSKIACLEPGTVLLCITDRLAYYEGEEENQRYILERHV